MENNVGWWPWHGALLLSPDGAGTVCLLVLARLRRYTRLQLWLDGSPEHDELAPAVTTLGCHDRCEVPVLAVTLVVCFFFAVPHTIDQSRWAAYLA